MLRRRSSKEFDESAANALLDAINRGKGRLVRFILDASKDEVDSLVNYCDNCGKTPLIKSIYIVDDKCRQYIFQLLLTRHADPNLSDDEGRTALSYACELSLKDVVRLLIRWNADPNISDKNGMTPLMYCAQAGNEVGLNTLLKCFRRLGLNVDQVSNDGYTALHLAAINRNIECASRLTIDGYASVTKVDEKYGRTAEQWARLKGCRTPEVVLFSTSSQKLQRPRHASRPQYNKSLNSTSLVNLFDSNPMSKSQDLTISNYEKSSLNTNKTNLQIDLFEGSSDEKAENIHKPNFGLESCGSLSDKEFNKLDNEEDFLSKSMSNINIAKTSVSKLKGKVPEKSKLRRHRHSHQYGKLKNNLLN